MWWQNVYALFFFFIQAEFVKNHITAEWTVERGWKINERGGIEHCVDYKQVLHLRDCSILNFSVPIFPRGLRPVRHSPNFGSKTLTLWWWTAVLNHLIEQASQAPVPMNLDPCPFWSTKDAGWVINVGNPLHQHMADCPLDLPPN